MTAPVLPFELAAGRPLRLSSVSLSAYAGDDVRAFVDKLRQLAALAPDRCGPMLRLLDAALAGIVEDFARDGELSELREAVLSPRAAYGCFVALSKLDEPECRNACATMGAILRASEQRRSSLA